MRKKFFALALAAALTATAENQVKVYPAPDGAPLNRDFELFVRPQGESDWQRVPCLRWKVDNAETGRHKVEETSVAHFDMEGCVEVMAVSLRQHVGQVRIRPLSYGLQPHVSGDTIRFSLDRSRYLSVEVNGDIFHNLQVLADPMVEQPTKKQLKRKDFIYYAPGYYEIDSLAVPSGATVYIDGGAYIKGFISVKGVRDVKILGHGIVNPDRQHEGIAVRYSQNVTVDGPLTTQIPVGGSDSVTVSNAKVMSWYGWGDGMNVFASNNVRYEHVFCRTSDDCSTIYCTRKGYQGGCRNITVRDAVYWADVAHPIMIGIHGDVEKNEVIEDVLYEDIDILENPERQIDYKGCIGINDGDNNLVRRVTFQDIRIESLSRGGMLLNFRVCYNKKYCKAPGRGIEDIVLRNISYNGVQPEMSIITGYNEERKIRNLRFENLRINGHVIYDDMPEKLKWYKTADYANFFIGEHVEGVIFTK